ncbi:MAG: Verru_Chthon cassette protein B [Verrucomicrobiota bacterium]|nr:Verru_Chthon cassette protein B [Verrucomicrobiota bacterium]
MRTASVAPLRKRGFSLVEVVLAVGVVAFGVVAIFALIPAGLGVFRQAMDTSVGSQIVQRIASDAAQADFDLLVPPGGAGEFFVLPVRYFDDQGSEVNVAEGSAPSAAEKGRIVYSVRVRGARPGAADPESHTNDYFTSLPSTGTRFNPRSLTILTVQIVHNPAARDLQSEGVIDPESSLVDPTRAAARGLQVRTYPVAVARNTSPPKP